jgi:cysteine desulfurase
MHLEASTTYLDYAASAPVRPEAMAIIKEIAGWPMNASSVHSWGRHTKSRLEEARYECRSLLGKPQEGLVFTSGGSEANAIALHQTNTQGFKRLIFSEANHPSLKSSPFIHPDIEIIDLKLDFSGTIDLNQLEALLSKGPRSFIALSLVNHETGVIQPHGPISELAEAYGAWLHWDAVQAVMAPNLNLSDCDGDSFAISAHKCGGFHGLGALIHRPDKQISSLYPGGGQEKGARSGTENMLGILGLGAALKANQNNQFVSLSSLEDRLMASGCEILGAKANRSGHIVCISQNYWSSQAQLIHCDMAKICVSMGSACSSGKVKNSPVASAMGLGHLSDKVLRISIGSETTNDELERFFEVWSQGYAASRQRIDGEMKREAS